MKTLPVLFAVVAILCSTSIGQLPAPAPTPVPPVPIKLPSTQPSPTPRAMLEQLQTMRDANVKILEQQAKTLLQLEEMQKTAQQIKTFGKRS